MLICTRAYIESKNHVTPRILCSLSDCYCMFVVWKKGKYEQSENCIDCPRYEKKG